MCGEIQERKLILHFSSSSDHCPLSTLINSSCSCISLQYLQREALTPNYFLFLSTSPLLCDHLHIKKGFVPFSLCISPSHLEGISPVLSLLWNIPVWGRVLTSPAEVQPLGCSHPSPAAPRPHKSLGVVSYQPQLIWG